MAVHSGRLTRDLGDARYQPKGAVSEVDRQARRDRALNGAVFTWSGGRVVRVSKQGVVLDVLDALAADAGADDRVR
jgi:hypothetical protein